MLVFQVRHLDLAAARMRPQPFKTAEARNSPDFRVNPCGGIPKAARIKYLRRCPAEEDGGKERVLNYVAERLQQERVCLS